MKNHKICILGGTGFVGHSLIRALSKVPEINEIRVLTHNRLRNRDLLVFRKVQLIEVDIHNSRTLRTQFKGVDAVINLVGILNQTRKNSFRKVHVDLVQKIVEACKMEKVKRFLHMSALHAGATNAVSQYLKTKGEGEHQAHLQLASSLKVTSFRPSVIFGEQDQFFNRFATLLKFPIPIVPLPCADTKFSPIFVKDVAQAFVNALDNPQTYGKKYNLCGPRTYTLFELVKYTQQQIGGHRSIIGINNSFTKLQTTFFGWLPGSITKDNYLSMQINSTCNTAISIDLKLQLTTLEKIVPNYLRPYELQDQYLEYRRFTGR